MIVDSKLAANIVQAIFFYVGMGTEGIWVWQCLKHWVCPKNGIVSGEDDDLHHEFEVFILQML